MAQRIARTPSEQAAAEKLKQNEAAQEAKELRTVLSTYEGRRLVWWSMELSGFYVTSFNGNSRDYYELGKRSVGAQLHARVVEVSGFEAFDLMRKEAMARQAKRDELAKQLEQEDDY